MMPNISDFVGRRKTRPLKSRQRHLLNKLLPQLRIDMTQPPPLNLADLMNEKDERTREIHLEIGFGAGEYLSARAKAYPRIGFIGAEPFINGIGKMLNAIDTHQLKNIRLYDDEAGQLLDWLPENSLSRVILPYPDPWPKYRHWKRRFVSPRNLNRIARVLKPGGLFLFASDIEHYVAWTLRHCLAHPAYHWLAEQNKDWMNAPMQYWLNPSHEPRLGTRYEAKALKAGRTSAYLVFQVSAVNINDTMPL